MKMKRIWMNRRIAALLLVLMLAAAFFAGCGAPAEDAALKVKVTVSFQAAVDAGYDNAKAISETGVLVDGVEIGLPEGATAYDAVKSACDAAKAPVVKNGEGEALYIESVSSLSAGDCGDLSGWLFNINGKYGSEGINAAKVADGDAVNLLYTVNMGEDIGASFE